MTEPLDAVAAIHNAFRRDMEGIDAAAFDSARGKPGLAPIVERFRFFNEVLVWHAKGEELGIFPALEAAVPSVAEAYERDHRALDVAFDALSAAVSAHDALETARATAAFKSHLDLHLDEEDAHLYRLVSERVPVPDQGKAVGIMSSTVPQERFVEVVAWIFPLMGHNDRENMTRIWQLVLPPPVFNRAKQLIQEAIGDDWAELTRRIPTGSCPQPSLLGPWLGIPQWVVLKRRLPSVRWWWILISAFGWGIQFPGMIPGLMLTRLLRQLGVPSCQ